MTNKHGGARPGAGRPVRPDWDTEEHVGPIEEVPDLTVWVEGKVTIYSYEDDKRVLLDKISPVLRELGLTPQTSVASRSLNVRRLWTTKRVRHDEIEVIVREFPGIHFKDLAMEAYRDKTQPWTREEQVHAERKLRVALRGVLLRGQVGRRYKQNGAEIYYDLKHPEAHLYSTVSSGRMRPDPEVVISEPLTTEPLRSGAKLELPDFDWTTPGKRE